MEIKNQKGGGPFPTRGRLKIHDYVFDRAAEVMRQAIAEYGLAGTLAPQLRYTTGEQIEHIVPLRFEDYLDPFRGRPNQYVLAPLRQKMGFWFAGLALSLADSPDEIEQERRRWPSAALQTLRAIGPKLIVVVQDHAGDLIAPGPSAAEDGLTVVAINPVKAVALVLPRAQLQDLRRPVLHTEVYESKTGDHVYGGAFARFYMPEAS